VLTSVSFTLKQVSGLMTPVFSQLNDGWNAEPNSPEPKVEVVGDDVLLKFFVNAFRYPEFEEDEIGVLRFVNCTRYRLGSTNDEGWYRGQCRFSKVAPSWGEFYLINGDRTLLDAPCDWKSVVKCTDQDQHFLFYFRDQTFECVSDQCVIETTANNSLDRTGKELRSLPSAELKR